MGARKFLHGKIHAERYCPGTPLCKLSRFSIHQQREPKHANTYSTIHRSNVKTGANVLLPAKLSSLRSHIHVKVFNDYQSDGLWEVGRPAGTEWLIALTQLPGVLHFACERGGIKIRGAEKNYSRARKK